MSEFDSMSCFLSPKKDSRILVWIIVAVLFFSLVMHLLELLNRLVTEWSVIPNTNTRNATKRILTCHKFIQRIFLSKYE